MPAKDEERAKRLAAALRENLRRRKAQTRAMPAPAGDRSKGSAEGDDEAVDRLGDQ